MPFNPLTKDSETRPKNLDEAKIGGLGISFMRRIFDDMSYHYGKEGDLFYNHLKLGMKIATN